jgi:hypothetical protein
MRAFCVPNPVTSQWQSTAIGFDRVSVNQVRGHIVGVWSFRTESIGWEARQRDNTAHVRGSVWRLADAALAMRPGPIALSGKQWDLRGSQTRDS